MHSSWLFNVRTWYNLTLFPWKASSARPSKRRSLTLFNQICNLQNSSTPFFQKHHLELDTGGLHPKNTHQSTPSCCNPVSPSSCSVKVWQGFAEFWGPVLVMFFLEGGGGLGETLQGWYQPKQFLDHQARFPPNICEFKDPCLVSMNARRWWSPTDKA